MPTTSGATKLGSVLMTTKRTRGNPGLKGRLLDKSVEAYIVSLETINRLSVKYRVETFAYLICNAWELLLKAKIIEDSKDRRAIYYPRRRGEPIRSLALRDCLKRVLPDENDPVRRNLERIVDLRDEAVHLVISQVPKSVLSLFQSCVLNYHKRLVDWFGISLSGRVSVGMMTIVYDFIPEQFDLSSPVLRRQLGRDVVEYLAQFQAAVWQDFERLNKPIEYSIDINYKLALVQRTGEADIVLTKGESGLLANIIEVPKDSSRTHPYRQKEVLEQMNSALSGSHRTSQYDIQCVVNLYNVRKRPEFYYKGTVKGSPGQYSPAFVAWLLREYEKDNDFFTKARIKAKKVLGHVRPA
jgi:hypothetical protein